MIVLISLISIDLCRFHVERACSSTNIFFWKFMKDAAVAVRQMAVQYSAINFLDLYIRCL